ncbi:cytochrome c oxidase assembly protein [Nonomuraea rhizosphaerae]|uniref:cytochrome c oxidase assembly protein n=1 Tax=Nonomuraea rhizosphaerae TaxID=2665663 RepID=UPI001C606C84|nr:cytochrome c oxidase assembly protein [Nonomuraea rhizosphaerae]
MVRLLSLSAIAALAALAAGMVAGGAAFDVGIIAIADPGALTRWGLPIAKTAANLAGALTAGLLLTAAALIPSEDGRLTADAARYARAAGPAALVWAISTALTFVFTLSEIFGAPLTRLPVGQVLDVAFSVSQCEALLTVLALSAGIALLAGRARRVPGTAALLALALVALLPPLFTGHSASSPNHTLAVTAVGLHIVTLALWVGGLAAVTAHALRRRPDLPVVAERFSRLALWCFAGVAVSGLAAAVGRLTELEQLRSSSYGQLIVAKTLAFGVLAMFGRLHRRYTLAELRDGRPRAFLRLALGEVTLMAAVTGLAVALSRTAPPALDLPIDPVRELLGYAMPPEVTAARLAGLWRLDLFFALLVAMAALSYGAGVARLRRRGETWPAGRSVAWGLGLAAVVVLTQSGIATYAPVLLGVHVAGHMGMTVVAPLLLVCGAPVTLALRSLRPAGQPGDRGPREWLAAGGRLRDALSHPATAVAVLVAGTCGLYLTSLFKATMAHPVGHVLMNAWFLLSGLLLFGVALRRIGALVAAMVFHVLFGVALMLDLTAVSSWYVQLGGMGSANVAGGMAWLFGVLPVMAAAVAVTTRRGQLRARVAVRR